MSQNKNPSNKLFILTVLMIFPAGQLAIDLYLPSLPAMSSYFHCSNFLIQLTLTAYILSLGISQLFYGPASDRFGRRPVLLFGFGVFFLASLACVLAVTINQLLLFRALQGLGMGCGFAVGSAILGDSFTGKKLARMTTFSSMIYSLSPIIAPVFGGYLQHYFGWRSNFMFMAFFCLLLLSGIFFAISETNKHLDKTALQPGKLLASYFSMCVDSNFIGNILCLTLAFGVMITFNIVGPFLLQNVLHASVVAYGQLLLLVGLAYCLGTAFNSQLLKIIKINYAIALGMAMMLVFALALLVSSWCGWFTVTSVVLFTCLEIFATGLVFPNCFAKALELFPTKLGVASAIIGSGALLGTSAISVIIARVHVYNESSLGLTYLIQAILCSSVFAWILFSKREPN